MTTTPRQTRVDVSTWLAGGVISSNPLVTYSRGGPTPGTGIVGAAPSWFRNRGGLHFVGLNWAVDIVRARHIAQALVRLSDQTGGRFVVLGNDPSEVTAFRHCGVEAQLGSSLLFCDEAKFTLSPAPSSGNRYNAVYNARFDLFKRHELATALSSLLLIYDYPAGPLEESIDRVRALLPQAVLANEMLAPDSYRKLGVEEVNQLLGQCRVGLCLSAVEGATRASVEYLLAGLPVVSTPSVGGRADFLGSSPFAQEVPPTPGAVAACVNRLMAEGVDRAEIREWAITKLKTDRGRFLEMLEATVQTHFGSGVKGLMDMTWFKTNGMIYRSPSETLRAGAAG